MKVMLSQPMNGRTQEAIMQERNELIEKFKKLHIEVLDTYFTEEAPEGFNPGVYFLGKSIEALSGADALYMCDGWVKARGCRIERQVAQDYDIKILYSDFFKNRPTIIGSGELIR